MYPKDRTFEQKVLSQVYYRGRPSRVSREVKPLRRKFLRVRVRRGVWLIHF